MTAPETRHGQDLSASGGEQDSGVTSAVAEKAGVVSDKAGEVGGQVRDKAGDAAVQVREKAGETAGQVREKAIAKADERKSQLVEQGTGITDEAEKIANTLREDGMEKPAELLQTAAREIREVLSYVENHSVEDIIGEVGGKARQSPIMYLGGAFALGFAASRLLKAEAPSQHGVGTGQGYGGYRQQLGTPSGSIAHTPTGAVQPPATAPGTPIGTTGSLQTTADELPTSRNV